MGLTTGQMAMIFAGCVLAIGVVVVLLRRGVLSPKPGTAASTEPNPPQSSEAAK